MNFKIQRAEVTDLEQLVQGQKKAFHDCYQRYQDHEMSPYNITVEMMNTILDNEFLYKIIYAGKIVGAIYVAESPDKYNMKLHGIFIEPDYQDKGLGQLAIEQVEQLHSEAVSWVLNTPHDLERNHHVYEKLGYKRTGVVDYVNENLSIIHYRKEVRQTANTALF